MVLGRYLDLVLGRLGRVEGARISFWCSLVYSLSRGVRVQAFLFAFKAFKAFQTPMSSSCRTQGAEGQVALFLASQRLSLPRQNMESISGGRHGIYWQLPRILYCRFRSPGCLRSRLGTPTALGFRLQGRTLDDLGARFACTSLTMPGDSHVVPCWV